MELIRDDLGRLAASSGMEGLTEAIADVTVFSKALRLLKSKADNAFMTGDDPGQSSYPSPQLSPRQFTDTDALATTCSKNPRSESHQSAGMQPATQTRGRFAAFLASDEDVDGHMADGRLSPVSRHSFDSHVDLPPAFRAQNDPATSSLAGHCVLDKPGMISNAPAPTREVASTGDGATISPQVDTALFNKLCKDITDFQTKVRTIEFKLNNPVIPWPSTPRPDDYSLTPPWAVKLGEQIETIMQEVQEIKSRPITAAKESSSTATPGREQRSSNSPAGIRQLPTPTSARPSSPPLAPGISIANPASNMDAEGMRDSVSAASEPGQALSQGVSPEVPSRRGLFGSVGGPVSNAHCPPITPLAQLDKLPQPIRSDNTSSTEFDVVVQSPPFDDEDVGAETDLFRATQAAGGEQVFAPETQPPTFTAIADSAKRRTRTKRFLEESPEGFGGVKKRKSTSVVTRKPAALTDTGPYTNTRARSRSAGSNNGGVFDTAPGGTSSTADLTAAQPTTRGKSWAKVVYELDSSDSESLEPLDTALHIAATRPKNLPARPRKIIEALNPPPGESIFALAEDSLPVAKEGGLIEIDSEASADKAKNRRPKEDHTGISTSDSTGSDDSRVSDFSQTTKQLKAKEARKKEYRKKAAASKGSAASRQRSGNGSNAAGAKKTSGALGAQGAKLRALQHHLSTSTKAHAVSSTSSVTARTSTEITGTVSSLMLYSGAATTTADGSPNTAEAQPREFGRQYSESGSESLLFSAAGRAALPSALVSEEKNTAGPCTVGGRSVGGDVGGSGQANAEAGGVGMGETLISGDTWATSQPVRTYGSRSGGIQISERRRVRGTPPPLDSDDD
jgi:hypothetical protein